MGLEYSYYYRTLLYYIPVLLSRGGKRTYAITHNIKYISCNCMHTIIIIYYIQHTSCAYKVKEKYIFSYYLRLI